MAMTPELRAWIEQECDWGRHALAAVSRMQHSRPPHAGGLDRFRVRMALVEITGSVAAWAAGLSAGLERWDYEQASAHFAAGPPFPETDTSSADYQALSGYLEAGMAVLEHLSQAARSGPTAG